MAQKNQAHGVFINGKEQIVELLKAVTPEEKQKFLQHIRMKNPNLAGELTQKSITLKGLSRLGKHEVAILCNNLSPKILGMALKIAPVEMQRAILKQAPRAHAEETYAAMITPINNEALMAKRAMEKVKSVLTTSLSNKKSMP